MRDEQNKKQGYCCGFFGAIIDCFSQCRKKKPTRNQYSFDDFAEGLFVDSPVETSKYHELEITPRPTSNNETKRDTGYH